jgi:aspartate 1-decarboxylase
MTPEEAAGFSPTVVMVDGQNRVVEVRREEAPGEEG